jgi:hypothetical protein
VVQCGKRLGFASEPGEPIRIIRERIWQDLQGHVAIELRIAGPPDLAHAAFANLGSDFVNAEASTEGEGQTFAVDYMGRAAAWTDQSCLTPQG